MPQSLLWKESIDVKRCCESSSESDRLIQPTPYPVPTDTRYEEAHLPHLKGRHVRAPSLAGSCTTSKCRGLYRGM